MPRLLLPLALLVLLSPLARADAIDDFTFTTSAHTFTFSLPALIPDFYPPGYPPPGPHVGIDNYVTSATGDVDGVGGHLFALDFGTSVSPFPYGFNLTVDGAAASYQASGPHLVSGPLTDFPTGTFSYTDYPIPQPNQIREGPYTLTITPVAATAPEPSSLVLLLTGAGGSLGLLTRRLRSGR